MRKESRNIPAVVIVFPISLKDLHPLSVLQQIRAGGDDPVPGSQPAYYCYVGAVHSADFDSHADGLLSPVPDVDTTNTPYLPSVD